MADSKPIRFRFFDARRGRCQSWLALLAAAALISSAGAVELPNAAPPPSPNPALEEGPDADLDEIPEEAPRPTPRPDEPAKEPAPPTPAPPAPEAAEEPDLVDAYSRPGLSASEDAACIARLQKLGVVFTEEAPLSSPDGCLLARPLNVTRLTPDLEIGPGVVIGCRMAEALYGFAAPLDKAARDIFGQPVTAIAQSSGYVCRPRAGTGKLSEHAFGNAFDIAGMTLADGTVLTVGDKDHDAHRYAFLARLRKEACGPFKTVLGPGADADHADHIHLDLAPRRNGSTFCQ